MSIKFGQIREILDRYVNICNHCDCGTLEDCNNPDCSTWDARGMRNEILGLFDEVNIETDPISNIPCTLNFCGSCKELPEKGEDGDCWVILEHKLENGCGWQTQQVFYWYDNKWNFIPNPPEHCRIHYV